MFQDIRFGLRTLLRAPLFTGAAVLCIALGIGANTAVFAFLYGIVLEPLPFPDSGRLIHLYQQNEETNSRWVPLSWPDYLDWKEDSTAFSAMAVWDDTEVNLSGAVAPARVEAAYVSWDLFTVLQVVPIEGRSFRPDEDQPHAERVAIISFNLWRDRFGSDPDIVGTGLNIQEEPHTIIGVMPRHFRFPEYSELWIPLRQSPAALRGRRFLHGVGRLAEGEDLASARSDLERICVGAEMAYPETNDGVRPNIEPLKEYFTDDAAEPAVIFYVVVTFVLLIACGNVANLMLARATSREKELAVRASLGAGRWRIARQTMVESLIVAFAGGGIGIWLGRFGRDAMLAGIPVELPVYIGFEIKPVVVAAMLVITALTGLLFGLAPAVRAMRFDVSGTLREGGGRAVAGGTSRLLRHALVTGEVALALTLLIAAGLSVKGLVAIEQVDPGLDPENVLTMRVAMPAIEGNGPARQSWLFHTAAVRLAALPGAVSAAAVSYVPMSGGGIGTNYHVEGEPLPEPGEFPPFAQVAVITPGYIETMGIPVLEGREFEETDRGDAHRVALVSERLARRWWPNSSALDHLIRQGVGQPWMRIVGVVGDVRQFGRDQEAPEGIYVPLAQATRSSMSLVVRFSEDPRPRAAYARGVVWDLDTDLPVYQMRTMERVIWEGDWEPPLYAWLFGVFAFVALVLSGVGVYGVVAYSVGQRTREFGIRMALGADDARVMGLVMQQGALLTLVGSLLGLLGAWWLMQFTASLLFGVDPRDISVYIGTTIVLAAVALGATWIPARRATRVAPVEALRTE